MEEANNLQKEISSLTNKQLAQRFKDEFNYVCGPISPTTRSVYETKLINLIKDKNGEYINLHFLFTFYFLFVTHFCIYLITYSLFVLVFNFNFDLIQSFSYHH